MRLTDLNPQWIGTGGEGIFNADGSPATYREKVALNLDCPCGCNVPLTVTFENPPDGFGPIYPNRGWHLTGDSFENMTLTPSIQREYPNSCWHGFITNGEIITC